jgi:tRNA pseudouridine55 synthase
VAPTGVVLYPKPGGVTSHDVVARVRRSLPRGTKVGHAGTLDPFATGLLLVLVGQATRAQRFLMALPKTYRVVTRLGWVSDTGDRDGALERGRLPSELRIPTGTLQQRPPAYSAVRVGGERAYRLARRGERPELAPRAVTVYRAELLWRADDRACFEIECSSGTYVRGLVAELGDAYCEQLERTAIGPFRLTVADPARTLPLEAALGFLPERALSDEEASAVEHGRRLPLPDAGAAAPDAGAPLPTRPLRLTHAGRLVALAEPDAVELRPVVVFAGR